MKSGLDELSAAVSSILPFNAITKKNNLFKKKLGFPFLKNSTFESFYAPTYPKSKGLHSVVKQFTPTNGEKTKTQTIFEKNNITNGKELTKVYLKNGVFSLTGVFEKIRAFCKSAYAYGANPAYFYRTPSFTWKVGLKRIETELSLLTDEKHRLILENNMRGGPASVMGSPYVKRSDKKIHSWDNDNLFGTSKCQYLPIKNFFEYKVTERNKDNIMKSILDLKLYRKNGKKLECDL